MNILRYRELSNYEIIELLDKRLHLTDSQRRVLINMDWIPFHIVRYEEPEPVRLVWRFSIVLYWIFLLFVILIVFPLYWLFTGKKHIPEGSRINRVYVYWTKRLGFV